MKRRAATAAAEDTRAQGRERLARSLTGRFWLRFHASLIMAGTFGAGFAANYAMLGAGLHPVLARWLLAIAVGYGAFFVLVRFWLAYVGVRKLALDPGSYDAPSSPGGGNASLPDLPWRGGGGRFGGAGATGDFAASRSLSIANMSSSSAGKSSTLADGVGSLVDGVELDDALPIVLGLVVLALVVALLGSAIAFVWMAPELLTDAAFAALLSGGALPGIRRAQAQDWHGTLLAATWKPLAAVVVVGAGAALALMHWFPGARTLGEALLLLR